MEIIGLILGLIGLFGLPSITWFVKERVILYWYGHLGSEESLRNRVVEVVSRRASPFPEPRNVGTYSPVQAAWFIDFLSAVTDLDDRVVLEKCLTRWIFISLGRLGRDPAGVDRIAVPKLGNILLADMVARRLRRPILIVRQEPSEHNRPGRFFEGEYKAGDNVILIDDISSDAEFLIRCVNQLKSVNLDVVGVLSLLDRKEGRCRERLADSNVNFAPLLAMNDAEIESASK